MAKRNNTTGAPSRHHAAILEDAADQLDRWGVCPGLRAAMRKQARQERRLAKVLGPASCEVQS